MSRLSVWVVNNENLPKNPSITKGILTSTGKKIQRFELISLLVIQWKKFLSALLEYAYKNQILV